MDINKQTECPKCGKSWDRGDIFEVFRTQSWSKGMTDEQLWKEIKSNYSEPYKFSKLIGVEDPKKYDGISYWECPHCSTTWDRWTNEEVEVKE